jgi:predicted small lipoprotein YifL
LVAFSPFDFRSSFALAALLTLAACGGGGNTETAPSVTAASVRVVAQSDQEIAQFLYADNQRTPPGFYQDPAPSFSGYVATSHLRNTDLSGSTVTPQFELCSDDWTIALGWSDQTAAAMSASTLVETNGTVRFHEFLRVRSGSPQGYLRTRVFRCDYLDRSSVDLHSVTSAAGQFNLRPLTAAALQDLVEYLWQFTTYNNYGNAVLKSSGSPTATGLQHTLVIASFESNVTGASCDRINVVAWTHAVDNQTGTLTRESQVLWEFGARRNAGLIELCNSF